MHLLIYLFLKKDYPKSYFVLLERKRSMRMNESSIIESIIIINQSINQSIINLQSSIII